jgi:RimJ/RimL family protein N-acetyltransferase
MVEVRYGISPQFWGKGFAKEAANAVMQWSVDERGVKRFIAETERENSRSATVLQKLGFVPSNTTYWKEPNEMEWECVK